jgi:hypothetical protein
VRDNAPVALGCIRYTMTVAADAPDELLEELRAQAQAHSPNAMTLLQGVRIEGSIRRP